MNKVLRLLAALAFGRLAGIVRDGVISVIVPVNFLPSVLTTIRWLNSGRSAISDVSVYPIFAATSHLRSYSHFIRFALILTTALAASAIILDGFISVAATIISIVISLTVFSFLLCSVISSAFLISIYLFGFNVAVAAAAICFVYIDTYGSFASIAAAALAVFCWVLVFIPGHPAPVAQRGSICGSLLVPAAFVAFVIHSPILFNLAGSPPFLVTFYWIERVVGAGAGIIGYALGMSRQAELGRDNQSLRSFIAISVGLASFALLVCAALWLVPTWNLWLFAVAGIYVNSQHASLAIGLSGIALVENVVFRDVVSRPHGKFAVGMSAAIGFIPIVCAVSQPSLLEFESQFATIFLLTMWLKCGCLWLLSVTISSSEMR